MFVGLVCKHTGASCVDARIARGRSRPLAAAHNRCRSSHARSPRLPLAARSSLPLAARSLAAARRPLARRSLPLAARSQLPLARCALVAAARSLMLAARSLAAARRPLAASRCALVAATRSLPLAARSPRCGHALGCKDAVVRAACAGGGGQRLHNNIKRNTHRIYM